MADDAQRPPPAKPGGRFLGSLREALAAAGRDDEASAAARLLKGAPNPPGEPPRQPSPVPELPLSESKPSELLAMKDKSPPPLPSAADAVKEARGGAPHIPPIDARVEAEVPPTTRVLRAAPSTKDTSGTRTVLVRGKQQLERGAFHQDPVVGWLVIVGGPGLGAYRPIFEGNNTVGRGPNQRISIDFGDDAISTEEQAYIRYDSAERSFLFVPNLAKTNVVSVNSKKPTAAVTLSGMDVIVMGRTQLVFVPFCGPEFDWGELPDVKS